MIKAAKHLFSVAVPLVIIALSAAFYRERRAVATFQEEILSGFTVRTPEQIPAMMVTAPGGRSRLLSSYCPPGKLFVVVFSSTKCRACTQLQPQWRSLAAEDTSIRLLEVDLSGKPPTDRSSNQSGHVSIDPQVVLHAFGIREIPAIVVTDRACHPAAVSAGHAVSSVLLTELHRNGT